MSPLPDGIRHVIVLMLENRSFDHLLGNLPGVDGPRGRSNVDPRDDSVVPVTFDAQPTSPALLEPNNPSQITGDPQHDFAAVNRQLFETDRPGPATPVTCGGFIMAQRASGDADASRIAREVMRCYDTPAALTTLTALASEFLVCDRWHASVPGPTWPNRLFVHAATSFGTLDNTPRLFDGTTIYDRLSAAHVDWAIYYHDMPQSLCFRELWDRTDRLHRRCMRPIDEFYKEVRAHRADNPAHATLPSYVFIEPGYFEPSRGILARLADLVKWIAHLLGAPIQPSRGHANDQHAPHDVRLGELLIADVYDALRANEDVWQHCLLVVLHDEHGGLYDHVHPGGAAAPEPSHPGDPFAFDRAGLRVPALLVSPFVAHGVDSTPYDHASIIRTVREHFCPDAAPLSERESHSTALGATFLPSPRPGLPRRITRPAPAFVIPRAGDAASRAPNDLQRSLLHLAAAVAAPPSPAGPVPPPAVRPTPPAAAVGAPPGGVAAPPRRPGVDLDETLRPSIASEADGRRFVTEAMRRHEHR